MVTLILVIWPIYIGIEKNRLIYDHTVCAVCSLQFPPFYCFCNSTQWLVTLCSSNQVTTFFTKYSQCLLAPKRTVLGLSHCFYYSVSACQASRDQHHLSSRRRYVKSPIMTCAAHLWGGTSKAGFLFLGQADL